MAAGGEFVEGWLVAQVLGEGAYGEVRLLVHARSGAAVALKAVRAGEGGEGAREAAIHRALRHPHVLRCLGERTHDGLHYMFLEYAQGGELFDRIEPDVGMRPALARRYWRQALRGLRYLHARGVAHRDIKPENLLLDAHDNIKISDFGMATLFRHGSRERLLSRVCGTVPYAAPEVLTAAAAPYRAPAADLWAAALVLAAMLAGELPWERACAADARFAAWAAWQRGGAGAGAPPPPFQRLPAAARALLRRCLAPAARARPALDQLLAAAWLRADDHAHQPESGRLWRSQPAAAGGGERAGGAGDEADAGGAGAGGADAGGAGAGGADAAGADAAGADAAGADGGALSAAAVAALLSLSQPAQADDLLLASQLSSPCTQPNIMRVLVRRATRVALGCGAAAALARLERAALRLGYAARRLPHHTVAIECDSAVTMRAWAAAGAGGGAVLEFRRSRGCGLEFKRRFLRLRRLLLPAAHEPMDH